MGIDQDCFPIEIFELEAPSSVWMEGLTEWINLGEDFDHLPWTCENYNTQQNMQYYYYYYYYIYQYITTITQYRKTCIRFAMSYVFALRVSMFPCHPFGKKNGHMSHTYNDRT